MELQKKTIGSIDYVICTVPEDNEIDLITKGMLLNNHIEGTVPVELIEMDGIEEYRYDVSERHPVTDIYEKQIRKQGLLTVLKTITETIIRARDYMIPEDQFLISEDYIYVDLNSCQTALLCIPAVQEEPIDIITCINTILDNCKTDKRESDSYVYFIRDFLKQDNVSIDNLNDMLGRIMRNEISIPERPRINAPVINTIIRHDEIDPNDLSKIPADNSVVKGNSEIHPLPKTNKGVIKPLSSIMNQNDNVDSSIIRPLSEIMNPNNTTNTERDSAFTSNDDVQLEIQHIMEESYEETGLLIDEEYTESQNNIKLGYLIRLTNNERIEIKGREFVIGRSAEQADYPISENRWISNMHASIISTTDGCYIRDLGSMNHTYLNDNMIHGKTEIPIPNDAIIRLGNERFRFKYN